MAAGLDPVHECMVSGIRAVGSMALRALWRLTDGQVEDLDCLPDERGVGVYLQADFCGEAQEMAWFWDTTF